MGFDPTPAPLARAAALDRLPFAGPDPLTLHHAITSSPFG
jgi:hypothetical protein